VKQSKLRTFLASPRGARAGLTAAHFVYWSALAPITYLSLYFEGIGLTGSQLGSMTAVRSIISFVFSIALAFLSDIFRKHKRVLAVCVAGMIATLLIIPRFSAYLPLLGITSLYTLFLSPIPSILDESTLRAVENPRDFSRIRGGGSIGWGLSIFLVGAILGLPGVTNFAIFPMHIILLVIFLALIPLINLPELKNADGSAVEKPTLADLRALVRLPRFMLWIGLAALWGFTESSVMSFFYQHIASIGGPPYMMGLSLGMAILGEIITFFLAKRVQGKIGSRRMMVYAFVLRFFWFVMLATFKNPYLALPFQLLGGGSFSLVAAARVPYVNERAPRKIGTTAQALRSAAILRLAIAFGAPINGWLYETRGSAYMYAAMAVVSVAALVLGLLLRRYDRRMEARNA